MQKQLYKGTACDSLSVLVSLSREGRWLVSEVTPPRGEGAACLVQPACLEEGVLIVSSGRLLKRDGWCLGVQSASSEEEGLLSSHAASSQEGIGAWVPKQPSQRKGGSVCVAN